MTRPTTAAAALREAVPRLRAAGVADAAADARLLLRAAAGVSREDLLRTPELPLDAGVASRFADYVDRRCRREPVARILGRREFHGLSFVVTAGTLDPRPDSETLVDAALGWCRAREPRGAPRILDLGAGTGCLALSLVAALPGATAVAVDASADACRTARRNARDLGLAGRCVVVNGSWTAALAGTFDLVVTNPPYIPSAELDGLQPEVARFEPRLALDGGPDGLAAHREIAAAAGAVMAPGAALFVEVGAGQAAAVAALFDAAGYAPAGSFDDLAGRVRCLAFGARNTSESLTKAGKKVLETR